MCMGVDIYVVYVFFVCMWSVCVWVQVLYNYMVCACMCVDVYLVFVCMGKGV